MIHVDRSRIPRPAILAPDGDSPARREFEQATQFYSVLHRQRRFDFKVYKRPEVRTALTELFYGKCAYCEVSYGAVGPVDIEMFRPKRGVVESPKHPGYWWLAMVWENLLASCIDCNRVRDHEGVKLGKANRFPLHDETRRAFRPGDERDERPLLLDPCADWPEQHLVFDTEGTVVSDTLRGQTTIAVLGLNRRALVESRRAAARDVLASLQRVESLMKYRRPRLIRELLEPELQILRDLCRPSEPFAALKRQLIKPFLAKWKAPVEVPAGDATPSITSSRKRSAKKAFAEYEKDQATYSLKDREGREKYKHRRRHIEQIAVRNVRAIRKLDLDMTAGAGRTWLMLLGENGTGKSTVLQATALALLGAESFVRLVRTRNLHPAQFVRYGQRSGMVSVKLSGFPAPHRLEFRATSVRFTSPTGETASITFDGTEPRIKGTGWEPQTLLLGYGATRLMPRTRETGEWADDREVSRVDNLFDPFVPLIDPEAWLAGLGPQAFDTIALILRDLLPLPADAELVVERGRVMIAAHGARVPLHALSDGYQSVVAMTVDILQVALGIWSNVQEAEGTVLLDEVGAHLHPTWKMRVVGALRKALPAMQFLATTHDPLCLRGLGAGEVAVMRRGEDSHVVALTGLPSPADFRVDQLLTSDFFGLNSTVDPGVEALFDEYYALLAMKRRTAVQKERLVSLRADLRDRRHFGTTLRDNLMYEAVDRLVAEHRARPALSLAELKQEAVDEIAAIWDEETV